MLHAPGRTRRTTIPGGPGTLTFNYYVNTATGNDANGGATAGDAWASLAPLRAAIDALPDNGALYAFVSGTFLDDHLRLGASVNAGVYAKVLVAAGTLFNATSGVDQSFTDSTGGPWTLEIVGQGTGETRPKIRVGDTGTGNGFGVTSNAGARLIYRNLIVENCVDGASLHGTLAYGEVYDCTFRNNTKSAFAHVHTGGSFTAKRCSFEGRTAATIGVGSETTAASANSLYEDCDFVPAAAGQACTFLQATVTGSRLGTLALPIGTVGGAVTFGKPLGPTVVTGCFVHATWDLDQAVAMTGCYGRITIRQRNGAAPSVVSGCVFTGPAAGAPTNLLYANFDPGSSASLTLRNTVVTGYGVAIGGGYNATYAGYFSASASAAAFLCFNGNTTDVQANLAALGSPYVANNLTANPLLGPCNTLIKNDWAVQNGSPCFGAGLGGADIGFRAS